MRYRRRNLAGTVGRRFLAFQSQCWHTNDQSGRRLPECDAIIPPKIESGVQIIAALVNPEGDDAGHETVTLINISPNIIDLSGKDDVMPFHQGGNIFAVEFLNGQA